MDDVMINVSDGGIGKRWDYWYSAPTNLFCINFDRFHLYIYSWQGGYQRADGGTDMPSYIDAIDATKKKVVYTVACSWKGATQYAYQGRPP